MPPISADYCHPGHGRAATHSERGDAGVMVLSDISINSNISINSAVGGAYSRRVAIGFKLVGTVNKPVGNGVGQRGVVNDAMPLFDPHLTSHDGES